MTQIKESDNCHLIFSLSSAGNISIIRDIVLAAPEVCRVANTKLPVSAALNANLNVSTSLISHNIITSLACLKAYFNQLSNDKVFTHTSLCSIRDLSALNINSIGSSIVIICLDLFLLMESISDVNVVDFHDHTLQVTSINQCFILVKSSNLFGNPNSLKSGNSLFIGLKTIQIQLLV
jgi:hypothetical protein